MSEVKRYDGKVGHSPEGGYVSYEDYATLQQKLIALGKELGVLKQFKVAHEWWQEKTDWVQKDKRFDLLVPWGKHRADVMREYIEHLEQQLTATTNILKSAGIEADTVQAGVMELKAQRDALAAENGAMRELIGATGFKSETPATDAYLNAVRAEGSPSVQVNDLKALMRFNDTCDDGEGYDIGEEAMNRLVELGLVAKERGKMRVITSFGMWVIAREHGEESGVLETQRDRNLAFQQKIAQLRASNAGKDGSHD